MNAPDKTDTRVRFAATVVRETAVHLLALAIEGAAHPALAPWLRAGLRRWLKSDGTTSLSAALHLGDSPKRVRRAMRDAWRPTPHATPGR